MTDIQNKTCSVIAKRFGFKASKIREVFKENIFVNGGRSEYGKTATRSTIEVETPEGTLYLGFTQETMGMARPTTFKAFSKLSLYTEFVQLEPELIDCMVFAYNATPYVVYKASFYAGPEGLCFKENPEDEFMYIIESLKNYMIWQYDTVLENSDD